MAHFNQPQKNPPWVRSNVQQQQPILAQPMTVQSVALSQPTLATTHIAPHPQNPISQVQITPTIQGHQVQLPLTPTHLLLNQSLAPAFGQVQINQAQLANISTSQQPASTHQTYFTPSISLQQNVGIPQGTIQIQPPNLVIPTSVTTSIAPPGMTIPATLATVHPSTTATYTLNRLAVAPPQLHHSQQASQQHQQQQQQQQHQSQQSNQPQVKQRVFSGLVTKLHENFGFVDEDVIFQSSVVKGTAPQVGDRVLVEASYNGSMPFKWNATRVQVIAQSSSQKASNTITAHDTTKQTNRDWSLRSRQTTGSDYRDPDRSISKPRDTRTRDRRTSKSSSRSPNRKRSRSPHSSPKRRNRTTPKYSVQIPKVSLDCREMNLIELRRRYSHMYVPSDFLICINWWIDSFPIQQPFPLDKPVNFHVFDKEVDSPVQNDAVFEPLDADYSFCAKVMLASLPSIEEMMRKCCLEDDRNDFIHPARLIRFLVGQRGKNETMAIGGPWSPSLDGPNPQSDPEVLIRTAIRTCKALTGIDLTSCSRWFRMAEIRYRRVSSGKNRIETVLLFVPDVWCCVPTADQWETVVRSYVQSTANEDQSKNLEVDVCEVESEEPTKNATHYSKIDPGILKAEELRSELDARNLNRQGDRWQQIARLTIAIKSEAEEDRKKKEESISTDGSVSRESSPSVTGEANSHQAMNFAASPKILVHPSRTFKGGKFTCSTVSLSVLLDYRPEDTKEHTFEVSIFSELFNEMLMRDFGALVYRTVLYEAYRKEKKKDEEDVPKKKNFYREHLTISTNIPPLLAFCYFDLSHCNYMISKDLEDLFLTLGIQLSRSQVRKLLQKVVSDDTLRYRKLTEKAVTSLNSFDADISEIHHAACPTREISIEGLSNGKKSGSSPNENNDQSSITVNLNGFYVNLEKLLQRLEQSEDSRRNSEKQLKFFQQQLATCRNDLSKAEENISEVNQQLTNEKLQTESTCEQLIRLQERFNKYAEAMNKISNIASSVSSTILSAHNNTKSDSDQSNTQQHNSDQIFNSL